MNRFLAYNLFLTSAVLLVFFSGCSPAPRLAEGVPEPTPHNTQKADDENDQAPLPYNLCTASWEKKPGTADYTTINWWVKAGGASFGALRFDRNESETLQGNPALKSLDDCQRAKILNRCFELSIKHDEQGNASRLLNWMKDNKLNPILVKMAFSKQETNLGATHDSCVRTHKGPICNGVGLMQIITAVATDGKALSDSDPRWAGISFNILTNLSYSARIMERKLPAANLQELAAKYNSNPNLSIRNAYSVKVPQWYHKFESCKLEYK